MTSQSARHFLSPKRSHVLERENDRRVARREAALTYSRCVAVVLVPGEGRWLRISEPHTPSRRNELRRYAAMFDDGYYVAAYVAKKLGFHLPGDRASAAPYAHLRDFLLDYTDDEILAARVALECAGPARSSTWENR